MKKRVRLNGPDRREKRLRGIGKLRPKKERLIRKKADEARIVIKKFLKWERYFFGRNRWTLKNIDLKNPNDKRVRVAVAVYNYCRKRCEGFNNPVEYVIDNYVEANVGRVHKAKRFYGINSIRLTDNSILYFEDYIVKWEAEEEQEYFHNRVYDRTVHVVDLKDVTTECTLEEL